jgi:hypothetical protein
MPAARRSNRNGQRLERISQLPLEPINYCRRWVKQNPAKGYRKSCINALARATGLSPNTIKDWGKNYTKRPQYIPYLLRQVDLLNQFKQLVKTKQIVLPPDFPQE